MPFHFVCYCQQFAECTYYYVYFRTKAETKKGKRNRIKKIVFLHEKTKVKADILDAKGHCYRFNYYLHTIHPRFSPKCENEKRAST